MTELLVADVGGTGSRLALFQDGRQITDPVSYANCDHESFESILDNFLADTDCQPDLAACAVAVQHDPPDDRVGVPVYTVCLGGYCAGLGGWACDA